MNIRKCIVMSIMGQVGQNKFSKIRVSEINIIEVEFKLV
jgi:hypothetical protein